MATESALLRFFTTRTVLTETCPGRWAIVAAPAGIRQATNSTIRSRLPMYVLQSVLIRIICKTYYPKKAPSGIQILSIANNQNCPTSYETKAAAPLARERRLFTEPPYLFETGHIRHKRLELLVVDFVRAIRRHGALGVEFLGVANLCAHPIRLAGLVDVTERRTSLSAFVFSNNMACLAAVRLVNLAPFRNISGGWSGGSGRLGGFGRFLFLAGSCRGHSNSDKKRGAAEGEYRGKSGRTH